jgi:hypothetical protein
MDGPTVSIDASGKHHKAFKIVALCICIAAVGFGLIDLSAGYHRVEPAVPAVTTSHNQIFSWSMRGFAGALHI